MTNLENQLLERLITNKKRLLVIDELLKQFLLQSNNMTHRHKDSRLNHILQIIETWNNEDKKLCKLPNSIIDDDIPF